MSRLDTLQKIIDATQEMINPKAEKILKELIDKAIPMTDYIDIHNIAEAIFGDAIDEGLSATDIHIAMKKIRKSGKYINYARLPIEVDFLAEKQMNSERVANLDRMNEEAQS